MIFEFFMNMLVKLHLCERMEITTVDRVVFCAYRRKMNFYEKYPTRAWKERCKYKEEK